MSVFRRLSFGAAMALAGLLIGPIGPAAAHEWRGYPHGYYGHGFRHFGHGPVIDIDIGLWDTGFWRHDWHGGRYGWWWVAGPSWYFYPRPIYPYPVYPNAAYPYPAYEPTIIVDHKPILSGPAPAPVWYYCDSAKAYYPYVPTCSTPWRTVPATPPNVR